MPPKDIELLIRVTEAQTEVVKENTRQLEKIAASLEHNSKTLDKINHHFTNGFKKDIVDSIGGTNNKIATAEGTITTNLSSVVTSIRIQWVIISLGLVPALIYVIKDVVHKV